MSNLQQYQADIVINNSTGEAFTSMRGLARICGVSAEAIRKWAGVNQFGTLKAEIITPGGLQGVNQFTEEEIAEAIQHYNPTLASQLMRLGVRALMHKLAGYEIKSTAVKPMTPAEAALYTLQLAVDTEARVTRLEAFAPLKDYYTITAWLNLNPTVEKPKHYPSTGKALVALSKLKQQEVKSVPDSKYGSCNAYHTSILEEYFNG